MIDINNTDDIKLYEDKLSDETKKTKTTEAIKCLFDEPSGRFLKLISIFEMGNLDKKFKFLSQRQLTIAADTMAEAAAHRKASSVTDDAPAVAGVTVSSRAADAPAAAGVAVSSRVADARPKRSLLVVVHPWRAFHQSAAAADLQSEFPPPGFLKHLRAKFLALRRETVPAAQQESRAERRHVWFKYAAVALGHPRGFNGNRAIMTSDAADDNKSGSKSTAVTVRRGPNDRMQ